MSRKEEWLDLYDKNHLPLNVSIKRGEKIPKNACRLVVHICIFNTKGEMLIQQRQSTKKSLPDKWDLSAGGQVKSGEHSAEGAQRELFEQLGIHADFSVLRPKVTMHFEEGFDDIYILTLDTDLDSLTLQPDEVKDAAWAGCEAILDMIRTGNFVPYHESYIRLLFALQELGNPFDHSELWTDSKPSADQH